MNFFKFIEKLKINEAALIFYCLLNRIPIIVFGNDQLKVDDFLIELSELIHFRRELVFYTDFVSSVEHNELIQNENIDFNSQRTHIRCPTGVALKALNQFKNFDSWLIGFEIPDHNERVNNLINSIRKKLDFFLSISLFSERITVNLQGLNWKLIDLSLEQNFLQKISQDTEKSITKMMRVLSEKIKLKDFDKDLIQSLLDFENEKKELKKNIIKKEIQNFFSGSKRAFFILSRLNLLNNIDIKTKIGSRTLLDTIDYYDAPIERVIFFIKKEWGEDFSAIVENGKKVNALDSIQSLWG
ncbi:MAG: hypothetical protein ACFFFB_07665 [Candidatus Heimdallarchaeota archaeon]